jgi:hypothetical protein
VSALFPKWTNHLPTIAAVAVIFGGISVVSIVGYWFSPNHTDVGYAPEQPIAYSHKLHAGLMGMDCRYCHNAVENGPHANIPATETCMNCHAPKGGNGVRYDSPEIQKLIAAYQADEPVRWEKVHLLPDYAYFHHGVHINAGVGCKSCHGRIDQMEVVRQAEPLSMGWCLECHRNPAPHIRPEGVEATDMEWEPSDASIAAAQKLVDDEEIYPPQHCSACHR